MIQRALTVNRDLKSLLYTRCVSQTSLASVVSDVIDPMTSPHPSSSSSSSSSLHGRQRNGKFCPLLRDCAGKDGGNGFGRKEYDNEPVAMATNSDQDSGSV